MKYQRVYTAFWAETRDWEEDERIAALYLLTCEHRGTEGLFRLPVPYAAHDMAWTTERVQAALDGLAGRGWAQHDGERVLLVNALRWQQPRGPKQIAGAVKAVADVPRSSPLFDAFHRAAKEYAPDLANAIDTPSEGYQTPSGYPFDSSNSNSSSNSFSSSSSTDDTAGAGDEPGAVVVVPPVAEVSPEAGKVIDTLNAVGLPFHDPLVVERLIAEFPQVDPVQAAIRCAAWVREKPRRVRHPYAALKPFMESDDAPTRQAATDRDRIAAKYANVRVIGGAA